MTGGAIGTVTAKIAAGDALEDPAEFVAMPVYAPESVTCRLGMTNGDAVDVSFVPSLNHCQVNGAVPDAVPVSVAD